MYDALRSLPKPYNEPVLDYAPRSPERQKLERALAAMSATVIDLPMKVGGREIHSASFVEVRAPARAVARARAPRRSGPRGHRH